MATLQVTQRRSSVGSNKRQLDTLRSLGLRRIGHTVEVKDCEQARGMVHAVRHLVEVHPRATQGTCRRAAALGTSRQAAKQAEEAKEEQEQRDRPALAETGPRQPSPAQARRARRRLRHRQDLRQGPEGRGLALGLQEPRSLRGWADADPHAHAQAARAAHEEVDAL